MKRSRPPIDQKDLARLTKLSTGTISNLFNPKKQIRVQTKAKIDHFFGWSETEEKAALWESVKERLGRLDDRGTKTVVELIIMLTNPK